MALAALLWFGAKPAAAGPVMSDDQVAVTDATVEASPVEVLNAAIVAGVDGGQLWIVYTNRSQQMIHRFEVYGTWQADGSARATFRRIVTMDLGPAERTTALLDLANSVPANARLTIGVTRVRFQNLAVWTGALRTLASSPVARPLVAGMRPDPQPGSAPTSFISASAAGPAATQPTTRGQRLAAPAHVTVPAPHPQPGAPPTAPIVVAASDPTTAAKTAPPAAMIDPPSASIVNQDQAEPSRTIPEGSALDGAGSGATAGAAGAGTVAVHAPITAPDGSAAAVITAAPTDPGGDGAAGSPVASAYTQDFAMTSALLGGMIIAAQPIPPALAGRIALLAADTPIRVHLSASANSATARDGDAIGFTVDDDVTVNGKLVIAKGALGYGHLQDVGGSSNWGRSGSITFIADAVEAADRSLVLLKGTTTVHPRKRGLAKIANLTVIGGLLTRGRNVTLAAGTEVTVSTVAATQIVVADASP